MARRLAGWSRSFRNDAQLKQYYLNGVMSTEKILGVGSYGSVMEVEYKQVSCAAKRMHELLLEPGNQGVQETIQKYRQECQLMASLRHPNITQFIGLCFLEGSELPLLVMEKLEMSVDDLLEGASNIPLPVKLSILTDTCSGLVYLHGMSSPIVHRDLTARNVLLTSSLAAKITDMGNSRIVHLKLAQLAQTMSKAPGTLVYMPPEALNDSHRYGPSLDVFSFGHLALYIFTQIFPGDLLSATHVDPHNPGRVIGHTEVERREMYMKKLENQYILTHPILVELVRNCLHNNPQTRPSSEQLLGRLQPVKKEVEDMYGGDVGKTMNMANVLQVKQFKQKNKHIQDLKASEVRLEAENAELTELIQKLENDKTSLESANAEITHEMNQVILNNNQLEAHISRVEAENSRLKAENNQLKTENSQLNSTKCLLEQEKHSLQGEVERQTKGFQGATVSEEKQSLKSEVSCVGWRRGPVMPVAMEGYIQSVKINGTLYVGGGHTDSEKDLYIVMAYSIQSCKWRLLPPYTTRGFAMTTLNSKLVLVGGLAEDDSVSSELGEWQPDSNQWTHPFPLMLTPRNEPSANSYKHWLVVAGGQNGECLLSIEVLDISHMQWSTRPPMLTPWKGMKSFTQGDTWYLMGGWCGGVRYVPMVYSVSLEALVSQSASDSSNIWRKLPSLDCAQSCPVIIGGSLLAVGGREFKTYEPVSNIQRYVPETDTWIQAGLLPQAARDCTCIMTSDKIYVLGGHDGKTKLKNVFTSNIQ